MPAKRSLTLALALLLVAAIPARAAAFPAITVLDTNSGTAGSAPYAFAAFSGYLYYAATNSAVGYELWRTDGTTLGTTLVKDINTSAGGSSYPWNFTALGDYLYFTATDDATDLNLWRVDSSGLTESSSILGTNSGIGCECSPVLAAVNGRLFMAAYSDETGNELAYLDEPTFVLPPTNRDGSVWSTTLVILAGLTAVAGVGLRMRGVRHVAS